MPVYVEYLDGKTGDTLPGYVKDDALYTDESCTEKAADFSTYYTPETRSMVTTPWGTVSLYRYQLMYARSSGQVTQAEFDFVQADPLVDIDEAEAIKMADSAMAAAMESE